jgi:hypothetical protein
VDKNRSHFSGFRLSREGGQVALGAVWTQAASEPFDIADFAGTNGDALAGFRGDRLIDCD